MSKKMTQPSYLGIFPRHTSQFYSLGPVLNQDRTPFKPTGAMFTLYNELKKRSSMAAITSTSLVAGKLRGIHIRDAAGRYGIGKSECEV